MVTVFSPQPLKVAVTYTPLFARLTQEMGLEIARQTALSSGFDLCASLEAPVTLMPGQRRLIPCGFSMTLPAGYEAQIRPRSGLALKHGLTVLNTPGTIDADYTGEVMALLVNLGSEPFEVTPGLRCAQMVITPVSHHAVLEVVQDLPATAQASGRGAGGWGSTGV